MLKAGAQVRSLRHSGVATAIGWLIVVALIGVGIWSTVVWLITFPMGLGLAGWLHFRTSGARLSGKEIFVAAAGSGLATVVTLAKFFGMDLLEMFWKWLAFWVPLAGILLLAVLSVWKTFDKRSSHAHD